MIRKDEFETKTCPRCKRPGWTERVWRHLLTEEEQMKSFEKLGLQIENVKGAPPGAERCYVSLSSTIHETVVEGKEIATMMNKPVAFDFNGHTVVVYKDSDVAKTVEDWWFRMYGETQAETFAKR